MKLIKLFITYLKRNEKTGKIYLGRASGTYTGVESQFEKIRNECDFNKNKKIVYENI